MNSAEQASNWRERLDQLVPLVLEDLASPEQKADLTEILRDNSHAQNLYLELVRTEAGVRWHFAQPSAAAVKLNQVGESTTTEEALVAVAVKMHSVALHRLWRVANEHIVVSCILSAIFLSAFLLSMAHIVPDWKRFVPGNESVPRSAEFVARVSRFEQAAWDKTSDGNRKNRDLFGDDTLVLNKGWAVVTYDTGARVVLEGPTTYQIQGANGGNLKHGKLIARVDKKEAQGFAVDIPGARITDVGTEFAVEVSTDGDATVAVLTGEVEFKSYASATGPGKSLTLAANEGASYDATNGKIVPQREAGIASRFGMQRRLLRSQPANEIATNLSPGVERVEWFTNGSPRLVGPSYVVTEVPDSLFGLTAIVAPRGPGLSSPARSFRFQILQPARLYLLVHNRGEHKLEGWQRTTESVTWTVQGQTHTDTVYTRLGKPGEVVIPRHIWRDRPSRYGVPHVCLVEPLTELENEPSSETNYHSN